MNLKKRIASIIICAILLVALFPTATVSAEESSDAQFDSIIDMESAPHGFDANDTSNPYGVPLNTAFPFIVQNELFVYQTNTADSGSWSTAYDNFSGEGGGMGIGENAQSDKGGFSSYNTYNSAGSFYQNVEMVAFNPTGSGRNDHVAFIGTHTGIENELYAFVWVLDLRNNRVSSTFCLGNVNWMKDAEMYEAGNFLAITAGDYYGNGSDMIVAYAPVDGENYSLFELYYDIGNNKVAEARSGYRNKSMLHGKYVNESFGKEMSRTSDMRNKLCADLASGDFDMDGYEDLAVMSYLNRTSGSSGGYDWDEIDVRYYTPALRTCYGNSGRISVLGAAEKSSFQYCYVDGELNSNGSMSYTSIAAPSLATGDIDGDGRVEAVIGGYKNTIVSKTDNRWDCDGEQFDIDNNNLIIAAYEVNNGRELHRSAFATTAASAFLNSDRTGLFPNADDVWQPTAVECVAMNGPTQPELLFVGTTLYRLDDGNVAALYTPDYFNESDYFATTLPISNTFIQSVTAGNFNGNLDGYEQVVFAVGLKQSGQNDYWITPGILGGKTYTGGSATAYYSSDIANTPYIFDERDNEPADYQLIAVDADIDGIVAKYVGKSYAYSDPVVDAVLQAAPYFGDLGTFDDFNDGSTTYSMTTEYEIEMSTTTDKSFGIGGALEFSAVFVKASFEGGSVKTWSTEFVESEETSITTEYTAGAENQVIIKRTPVTIYLYVLQQPDGSWPDMSGEHDAAYYNNKCLQVSMPGQPVIVPMSIERYNAFVDYYNSAAATKEAENPGNTISRLVKITGAQLTENLGNPWAYRTSWTAGAGEESASMLSAHPNELGHSSGATSNAWEHGTSQTQSISYTSGYTFSLTICGGGNFGVAEAWAGVSSSYEYSDGYGRATTTGNSTGISGTVNNLTSEGRYTPYRFNWSFGKWDIDLGGDTDTVPVFGYSVTDIVAPSASVSDLTVSYNEETREFTFIWTDPDSEDSGRVPNIGYYVYKIIDGEYVRINEEMIPKGQTSLTTTVDNAGSGNVYSFAMTTVSSSSALGASESDYSNEVTYILGMNGKSAYEIAVEEGFSGSQAEWIASLAGENGAGIASITLDSSVGNVDTYIITYGDGDTVTFSVTNGADGAPGREIELRSLGGVLQWRYIGDTDWVDLMTISGTNMTIMAREVELRTNAETGAVEWRYIGSATWQVLATLAELTGETGATGADGREISIQVADGQVQWQYEGDTTWTNLVSVEELQGEAREVEMQVNYVTRTIQWKYVGNTDWVDLMSLSEMQGIQGESGRGVRSIELTDSDGLVDTYTITFTDNSTDTFTVTNGRDGVSDIPGPAGERGARGIAGATGATGAAGADGAAGAAGADGADGALVTIASIVFDENGNLVFTTSDGQTIVTEMPSESVSASVSEATIVKLRTSLTIVWIAVALLLCWNVALTLLHFKNKKLAMKKRRTPDIAS